MNYTNDTQSMKVASFQENVITTGSNVSVILMIMLFGLFIVQSARKIFDHYTSQRKLNDVQDIWESTIAPLITYDIDPTKRSNYEDKQRNGASLTELKLYLLQRAVECVEKMILIQRDGRDIRKSQRTGLCPQSVWQDFVSAPQNIDQESKLIQNENQNNGFEWGKHKSDIFSKAAELVRTRNLRNQQQARTQQTRTQTVSRSNQRSKPGRKRR
mmetsp:Transcript_5579/g.4870  ORF Transcript_5579/g.4870 Transcript_5579/m.4870 type:complete len:214 (+) Transcript_5579:89-730(+)